VSTKPFSRTLTACILCRSSDLDLAVPLAPMPIATPTFKLPDHLRGRDEAIAAASLDLKLCRACGHLQTTDMVDPEFNYNNYVYKTASSLGLVEHFRGNAEQAMARYKPAKSALVAEIGSNDGSLLRFFKDRGHRVLGIDPAQEIARQATANGIETWARFFDRGVAQEAAAKHGQASIILANNVIANIESVGTFTAGLDPLLAPDGVFIFETQYGADVIDRMLLDTVYNEHLSYFMVRPLATHFERQGYQVIAVDRIPTKGGSIRVAVERKGGPRTPSPEVAAIVADEERRGMFGLDYYRAFADRVQAIRQKLHAIVDAEEKKGRFVAGYGVSVGTTSLIHQFGLIGRIRCLFDDNPERESHLRGPGYAIPVLPGSAVAAENPGAIIVFAWRYIDPIAARQQAWLAQGGRFVLPLPEVSERTR
jgi:hypothetical protein